MTRIARVDIPRGKHIVVSLTYVYGIGDTIAKKVSVNADISGDVRVHDLTNEQTDAIRAGIDKLKVEGGLRRGVSLNIKHLTGVGSCHGIRHRRGLPTCGRNTKSDARTHKSPTETVAGKKK